MRYMNADQWNHIWSRPTEWRAHWTEVAQTVDTIEWSTVVRPFLDLCALVRKQGSPKNRVLMHRLLACHCGKDGVEGLRTFVLVDPDGYCVTSFTRQDIRNVESWKAAVARKTGRDVYEIQSHKGDESFAVSAFAQKPAGAISALTAGRATGGLI